MFIEAGQIHALKAGVKTRTTNKESKCSGKIQNPKKAKGRIICNATLEKHQDTKNIKHNAQTKDKRNAHGLIYTQSLEIIEHIRAGQVIGHT